MKKIKTILLIGYVTLIVACAPLQPRPEEIAAGQRAIKPTSQDAAENAVVEYFSHELKDPQSAQYKFMKPTNSYFVESNIRLFGWFMCGTVNAKNSFGGYVGAKTFFAHFDPNNPNNLAVGTIDNKYGTVAEWCRRIYGKYN